MNLITHGLRDGINYKIVVFAEILPNFSELEKYSNNFIFSRRKSIKIGNRSIFVYKKIDVTDENLIITEYAIRNLLTYSLLASNKTPLLAFWGHGRTYTKRNTRVEEWLKTKLALRANWFFGYTAKGVDALVAKGFPSESTTIVRNSTDTVELSRFIENIRQEQVSIFRMQQKLEDLPTAVFIGELGSSKRIDFLIASAIEIHNSLETFQLAIFGDGPELHKVLSACSKFSFIKYCGRADLATLALVSKIGDCILMPGRVGLVAVDSLTLGLPIVTTNWRWHAPEIEYLTSGENCLILEDTLEDYSRGVVSLLSNNAMLEKLKRNCVRDSKFFSIEVMARNFHAGVLELLFQHRNLGEEMIES